MANYTPDYKALVEEKYASHKESSAQWIVGQLIYLCTIPKEKWSIKQRAERSALRRILRSIDSSVLVKYKSKVIRRWNEVEGAEEDGIDKTESNKLEQKIDWLIHYIRSGRMKQLVKPKLNIYRADEVYEALKDYLIVRMKETAEYQYADEISLRVDLNSKIKGWEDERRSNCKTRAELREEVVHHMLVEYYNKHSIYKDSILDKLGVFRKNFKHFAMQQAV